MSKLDHSALEQLRPHLNSAVISDALDSVGYRKQVMRPFVRPVDINSVLIGRCRTGVHVPFQHRDEGSARSELDLKFVDSLGAGDVAIFACGGPTEQICCWGDLLTAASMARGARGLVTDGLVRDAQIIRRMGFPTFHGGLSPIDTLGRSKMIAMDVAVECGGVLIHPGDFVFADEDGVVIVPAGIADELFPKAAEKFKAEAETRELLRSGKAFAEVFARHGVI